MKALISALVAASVMRTSGLDTRTVLLCLSDSAIDTTRDPGTGVAWTEPMAPSPIGN